MVRARREAIQILAAWFVCLVWTIGYCALAGYGEGPVTLVAGLPRWALVGVILPWVAATAFSVWFALRCMRERPQ